MTVISATRSRFINALVSRARREWYCRRAKWDALYHAKGVERLVRNDLWRGRSPQRYYDALEWLYGWRVDNCLAR
jgi:hypothetical protein